MLRRNESIAIVGIILSVIGYTFFILNIVVFDPQNRLVRIDHDFTFIDNPIAVNYDLTKDSYLLTIQQAKNAQHSRFKAFFNGIEFKANTYPGFKERNAVDVAYIHVSPSLIKEGSNRLSVIFPEATPENVQIVLCNYRKNFGNGIYLLFADSAMVKRLPFLQNVPLFVLLLLLSAGMSLYRFGKRTSPSRISLFINQQWSSISFIHTSLLMFLGVCYLLHYTVIITPCIFIIFLLCVSILLFWNDPLAKLPSNDRFDSNRANLLIKEAHLNIKVLSILSLLIIVVNGLLYWPSFFHLFRHDEWFMFFSSRQSASGWKFIMEHFDWQLKLGYDRLMFRPLSHTALALNKVLFGTNYIGPHLLTFTKHLVSVFMLWWLMWLINPRWIAGLFALLFSVLVTNVDAVIWPHLDAYISTTIITILIIVCFRKTVEGAVTPKKGCGILVFLLWLNLLTTEITFLMPGCCFVSYRLLFRKKNNETSKKLDRGIWFVLLAPYVIWMLLYAIHLNAAYPDISLSGQSGSIGLLMPFVNIWRMTLILLSGIFMPMLVSMTYTDKVYICVLNIEVILAVIVVYWFIKKRKSVLVGISKDFLFCAILFLSILIILSFGRAAYIASLLNENKMTTHYPYLLTALMILMGYSVIDFNKIASNKSYTTLLYFILLLLSIAHIIKINGALREIRVQTQSLKRYYDSVNHFVSLHRGEQDFSFKVIDRPPVIKAFNWYSQTCIDSMFYQFTKNENPVYLLEYDYDNHRLLSSLYHQKPVKLADMKEPQSISRKADFVNSIGMMFKKTGPAHQSFLIGCFEVTQKQWSEVMGSNPSTFIHPAHPVENVTYLAVSKFIHKLNSLEKNVSYRLPTLTEYLYLCKDTGFLAKIEEYGWFENNSEGKTHSIGTTRSIYQDVYDVIGNVWEWTATPIHSESPARNYKDNPHICFGGSWRDRISNLSELSTNYPVDFSYAHLGFRLVARSESPAGEHRVQDVANKNN